MRVLTVSEESEKPNARTESPIPVYQRWQGWAGIVRAGIRFFLGGYGNLKGHKREGIWSMDSSVGGGGSLSRDIEMESLRSKTGSGSSESGGGDLG